MARPSKYNWEAIKEAYEGGFDKDDIVKKYKITKKQLSNKIRDENWEVKGHITNQVDEFYATTHKTAQNVQKLHPENQEIVLEKVNTIAEDNELMQGTRKISKLLLSVIAQNRNDINLKNIKSISSTLKDIESIANPRPDAVINNTTQSFSGVKLIDA